MSDQLALKMVLRATSTASSVVSNKLRLRRKTSRNRLLALFLATAFPILLLATTPSLRQESASLRNHKIMKRPENRWF